MGFYYVAYKKMKNQKANCKINTDHVILETTDPHPLFFKAHLENKKTDKG